MKIEENRSLAPLTTFGIGGPARWFATASREEEIVEADAWARSHGVPLFVLGGGSNLLVSDAGFPGLVLHVGLKGIEWQSEFLSAAAGEDWDAVVTRAVERDCAGIECLAGIPGTVGGTPVQNVGAYGQEVATSIGRVGAFDRETLQFVEFSNPGCHFSYRRSRFNTVDRGRYIVTRVDYRLRPGGAPQIAYQELKNRLAGLDHSPSLSAVATAVRAIRQGKGMLLVSGDPDCRSAGSFFKNPEVPASDAERVRAIAGASATTVRFYAVGDDRVKIPAAWLIEQSGFGKGYALGSAGLSSRHTLALINRGNARAEEILALAGQIRGAVNERFGIRLEMEPVMVGF